jgi:hypothetical protein
MPHADMGSQRPGPLLAALERLRLVIRQFQALAPLMQDVEKSRLWPQTDTQQSISEYSANLPVIGQCCT